VDSVISFIAFLIQGLIFAIFIRAILSWFPIDRGGPIVRAIESVTEPVLDPLRRVLPRVGAIDIAPMVAIILLLVVSSVLRQA
jgi:YggT family protein